VLIANCLGALGHSTGPGSRWWRPGNRDPTGKLRI